MTPSSGLTVLSACVIQKRFAIENGSQIAAEPTLVDAAS
jgi:hypothetical protein